MTTTDFLSWLLEASVAFAAAVVLILAARRLARGRVGAGWIYALWLAVPASLAATLAPAGLLSGSSAGAASWLPALDLELPPLDFDAALDGAAGGAGGLGLRLPSVGASLLGVWLLGVALLAARHVGAQLRFERAVAACGRRPLADEIPVIEAAGAGGSLVAARDFRVVEGFASPVACGVFRPRVLLPEGFFTGCSPEERRVMTLHEAEHLRAGHVAHRLAARLLRDLFWFHPLAWIAERAFVADQELACDRAALQRDRSIRPKTYAATLLKAASRAGAAASRAPAASAPLTRAHDLEDRTAMLTIHAALGRTRAAGVLVFAAVASVSVLAAGAVTAEPAPAAAGGSSSGVISDPVGRALNLAIECINARDYAGAEQAMAELNLGRLTPYERSRAEQILFQIDYQSENYEAARAHLQAAIDAGGLNEEDVSTLRYQIAQTYMVEERWAEGALALEAWFRDAAEPNSAAYYLLAVAYYQQDDFAKALPPAERAVALAGQPQESWLMLPLAIYTEQERFEDAVPLLERLVAMAPEKQAYRSQLILAYERLGMTAEIEALSLRRPPQEEGDFSARRPLE